MNEKLYGVYKKGQHPHIHGCKCGPPALSPRYNWLGMGGHLISELGISVISCTGCWGRLPSVADWLIVWLI